MTTKVQLVSLETLAPPPWISAVLNIPHDDVAVRAVRLRLSGNVPVMATEAWVPKDIGQGITPAKLKKLAMYEILTAQGVEFGRVVQVVSAESADPVKAELLKCELSTALIRLTRLLHDREGRPIQHLTAHMTPQHSSIVMEIPGDAINTLGAGRIVHA
jgi:GntR family transcriptional regulator